MSVFEKILIIIGVHVLIAAVQYWLKARRSERHLHLIITFLGLAIFTLASFFFEEVTSSLMRLPYFPDLVAAFNTYYENVFVMVIILLFLLLRQAYFQFLKKREIGFLSKPIFAYMLNRFRVPVLKSEFEIARYASWIMTGFAFIGLAATLVLNNYPSAGVPLFMGFSLTLFIELSIYFNGNREIPFSDDISGEDVEGIEKSVDNLKLWEKYEKIWNEKRLVAWVTSNNLDIPSEIDVVERKLESGEDLIFGENMVSLYEEPLADSIIDQLQEDKRVLLLAPYTRSDYLEDFKEKLKATIKKRANTIEWNVSEYYTYRPPDANLLILHPNDIVHLCKNHKEWIKGIGLVIYFEANELFADSLNTCSYFSDYLQGIEGKIRTLVIIRERQNSEAASKENLNIDRSAPELEPVFPKARNIASFIWQLDGIKSFQDYIFSGHIPKDLGGEPVLSVVSLAWGRKRLGISEVRNYPVTQQIQETQNNKSSLNPGLINLRAIGGDIADQLEVSYISGFTPLERDKILFIRDIENNFINAFRSWERSASHSIMLHIITLPYMLREYFTAHFEYFYCTPLDAFSALRSQSRFNIALSLLQKLLFQQIDADEIRKELVLVMNEEQPVYGQLSKLFSEVFGKKLEQPRLQIVRNYFFDQNSGNFKSKFCFSLTPSDKYIEQLSELVPIYIKDDETGEVLEQILYGHLYQNYLPFQVHNFNGKPYQIPAIVDWANRSMVVNHFDNLIFSIYRPCLQIHISSLLEPLTPDHHKNERGVSISLLEGDFTVKTPGYIRFHTGLKCIRKNTDYTLTLLDSSQVPERHYITGRLLKLDFPETIKQDKVAQTLCIVLNEIFVTLFPDNWRYLRATTQDQNARQEFIHCLIPDLTAEKESDLQNTIIIVEDSFTDTGSLLPIFNNWEYILMVLDDYLEWCINGSVQIHKDFRFNGANGNSKNLRKKEVKPGEFLHFGFESLPDFLNLVGAKALLEELMGDNPMTRKRKTFYEGPFDQHSMADIDYHECDFCGRTYKTGELDVLNDGRERCKDCKESAINTLPELETIYQEGRFFLENALGLGDSLPTGINVRFTTAKEIATEFQQQDFTPTPKFDPRPLGFARQNKGTYDIFIENGLPFHQTLETVVHELTHIWQYFNLDCSKMKKDHGNLLMEGHALWGGLMVLEQKNIANKYCELQKKRDDEYGKGYELLIHLFDQYPSYRENPFEMLKMLYPGGK